MSIRIKSNPVPIAQRICAECQNATVCKYRDSMDDIRSKLLELTAKDAEGKAEIDLGVHFEMLLNCAHFRSNVNTNKFPEIDLYHEHFKKRNMECEPADRTEPVDFSTK